MSAVDDDGADTQSGEADPQDTDASAKVAADLEDGATDWFSVAGSDSTNDKLLQVADEAVEGRHEFKKKIRRFLRGKPGSEKLSTTKAQLEEQIAIYDGEYDFTRDQAAGVLSEATEAHANYKQERQSGAKKAGKIAQGFVKGFADFIHAYSGIIELLRGAGQVYGDVAYETLSILFIVVVNKSGNDKKITALLHELRTSFPQLDGWINIYPTLSMKASVTEVYKQIINFARHASIYFTRFSTRLRMAIGRPPSMGVDKIRVQIHQKLAEVSSEATFQLHKRNQTIYITGEDTNAKIRDLQRLNGVLVDSYQRLQAQYEEFRAQIELELGNQDKQNLEMFKETLNLDYPSLSTNPTACLLTITKAFPLQKKTPTSTSSPHRPSPRSAHHMSMTPDFLISLPGYATWSSTFTATTTETTKSPSSALLLLAGTTDPEARSNRGFTHSWLSPAALHVVETIRKSSSEIGRVAFYCCHPGVRSDESHHVKQVIASLAYQVLEWEPKVLRRKMVQLKALVGSAAWRGGDRVETGNRDGDDDMGGDWQSEKAVVGACFRLLKEVLVEMRSAGMTYLVLDRVDLVDGCAIRCVMEELVSLVQDEDCCVRIFVVIDTVRGVWDAEGMEEEGKVMALQDLDQKRLSTVGTARLLHSQSYQG